MALPQEYPRIHESEKFGGYLDESRIVPHRRKISGKKLRGIITAAVRDANLKSSRAILQIPETVSEDEMRNIYLREGKKLFTYFKDYCGDPASNAFEYRGKHYKLVRFFCNTRSKPKTAKKKP